MAQRIGFKHVVELDAFDSLAHGPDMEIVSIPFAGEHGELFSGKSCWLVRAGGSARLECLDVGVKSESMAQRVATIRSIDIRRYGRSSRNRARPSMRVVGNWPVERSDGTPRRHRARSLTVRRRAFECRHRDMRCCSVVGW